MKDNAAAMFVTVFIGVFDLISGTLTYANAGHNAPLLLRAGVVQELDDALAVPLGTMSGMDFSATTFRLKRNDLLYLFTDGVNESMNADNEEFGDKRMQAMVSGHQNVQAQSFIDETLSAVQNHAGSEPQSDDITLLVMRYLGQSQTGLE